MCRVCHQCVVCHRGKNSVVCCAGLVLLLALALRFSLMSSKSLQKELNARHLAATQEVNHSGTKSFKPAPSMAVWPLLAFDTLTAVALLISALAHIFSCMLEEYTSMWWVVDQVGITLGMYAEPSSTLIRICSGETNDSSLAAVVIATPHLHIAVDNPRVWSSVVMFCQLADSENVCMPTCVQQFSQLGEQKWRYVQVQWAYTSLALYTSSTARL